MSPPSVAYICWGSRISGAHIFVLISGSRRRYAPVVARSTALILAPVLLLWVMRVHRERASPLAGNICPSAAAKDRAIRCARSAFISILLVPHATVIIVHDGSVTARLRSGGAALDEPENTAAPLLQGPAWHHPALPHDSLQAGLGPPLLMPSLRFGNAALSLNPYSHHEGQTRQVLAALPVVCARPQLQ
jgi:hypothetical protein